VEAQVYPTPSSPRLGSVPKRDFDIVDPRLGFVDRAPHRENLAALLRVLDQLTDELSLHCGTRRDLGIAGAEVREVGG